MENNDEVFVMGDFKAKAEGNHDRHVTKEIHSRRAECKGETLIEFAETT